MRLLDFPAIWLGEQKCYGTAKTRAKSLQRFSGFSEKKFKYDEKVFLKWWMYVDTAVIKEWKASRIIKRIQEKSATPSDIHIDRDAKVVCKFLNWIKHTKNVRSALWDGNLKTVIMKSKNLAAEMLRGIISPSSMEVLDDTTNVSSYSVDTDVPFEGFAKRKQSEAHEYLTNEEMSVLCNSFPDKVYKHISLTGYITGLRTREVIAVPCRHEYADGSSFTANPVNIRQRIAEIEKKNIQILAEHEEQNKKRIQAGQAPKKKPVLKMRTIILKVLGKGRKLRRVTFNLDAWLKIMESWWPLYIERKKLYEKQYGALPLNVLWLDKKGNPIYAPPLDPIAQEAPVAKLQNAFYYISNGRKNNPLAKSFGHIFDYYCLRHTYATNFILNLMKAKPEKSEQQWLTDIRCRAFLARQMGHNDINTTYSVYVHNAILLMEDFNEANPNHCFPTIDDVLNFKLPTITNSDVNPTTIPLAI
jgi:integrase